MEDLCERLSSVGINIPELVKKKWWGGGRKKTEPRKCNPQEVVNMRWGRLLIANLRAFRECVA